MQEIKIHKWILEVDVEKTYEQYKSAKWDLCDCTDCLNYYKAMNNPSEEQEELFKKLGIIPSKCVHLSEYGPFEEGLHLYNGCYHIVGKIKEGEPVDTSSWNEENTADINGFSFVFSNDLDFVPGSFPRPVIQMDFTVSIPWVIEDPYGQ